MTESHSWAICVLLFWIAFTLRRMLDEMRKRAPTLPNNGEKVS